MSIEVDIPYGEIRSFAAEIENTVTRVYAKRRYPIAETFIDYCTPFVPVKSGRLRMGASIVDNGYAVKWSAINPRTGYDYAQIQHEVPMHHPQGGTDHWEETMLDYEGDNFLNAVAEILKK